MRSCLDSTESRLDSASTSFAVMNGTVVVWYCTSQLYHVGSELCAYVYVCVCVWGEGGEGVYTALDLIGIVQHIHFKGNVVHSLHYITRVPIHVTLPQFLQFKVGHSTATKELNNE